jgi:hypothetical protein
VATPDHLEPSAALLTLVDQFLHQQNLKNLFAFLGFSAAFPVADKRDKLTSWDPISWI